MFTFKNLMFIFITFGLIHIVSNLAVSATGQLGATPASSDYNFSFWGIITTIGSVCSFNYDYLGGNWQILRWILTIIQGSIIILFTKESLDYLRGRG